MRLPKKLLISGKTYKIKKNNLRGASFDILKQEITIGTFGNKDWYLEMFLHEVIEIIFLERGIRYSEHGDMSDNGSYMFVFDHKTFADVLMPDITSVLKQIRRIE